MITLAEMTVRLSGAAGRFRQAVEQELRATALEMQAQAQANATQRMRRRTGDLLRSIVGRVEEQGSSLELVLGVRKDLGYPWLQEQGGTITPKRGRFLAIPTGPALTGAGVHRYSSPRDVPGLRYQSIRGGAMGLLVRDVPGRRARSEIYYILVRRVTIKPKHYLRDAYTEGTQGLNDRLRARFESIIQGGV